MHRNVDEHLDFVCKIFGKFRKYNLRLHPNKMNIATSTANFLGYTLNTGGYTVDTGRCKIVKDYPRPKKCQRNQKVFGHCHVFQASDQKLQPTIRTVTRIDGQRRGLCMVGQTRTELLRHTRHTMLRTCPGISEP